MAYIKKPLELVNRSITLEQPVSELLDDTRPRSKLRFEKAPMARPGPEVTPGSKERSPKRTNEAAAAGRTT